MRNGPGGHLVGAILIQDLEFSPADANPRNRPQGAKVALKWPFSLIRVIKAELRLPAGPLSAIHINGVIVLGGWVAPIGGHSSGQSADLAAVGQHPTCAPVGLSVRDYGGASLAGQAKQPKRIAWTVQELFAPPSLLRIAAFAVGLLGP